MRKDWFRANSTAEQIEAEKQMPMRTSPKDDHASNGAIESVVQGIEGLTRTLRFAAELHLGARIGPSSPLLPWIAGKRPT